MPPEYSNVQAPALPPFLSLLPDAFSLPPDTALVLGCAMCLDVPAQVTFRCLPMRPRKVSLAPDIGFEIDGQCQGSLSPVLQGVWFRVTSPYQWYSSDRCVRGRCSQVCIGCE